MDDGNTIRGKLKVVSTLLLGVRVRKEGDMYEGRHMCVLNIYKQLYMESTSLTRHKVLASSVVKHRLLGIPIPSCLLCELQPHSSSLQHFTTRFAISAHS